MLFRATWLYSVGFEIGAIGSNSYLYAANFAQARVDVFGQCRRPRLPGNFTDPNLSAGFGPFGMLANRSNRMELS
jgi:hypothetical protein